MANYERTFKSAVWNEDWFEELSNTGKLFYYLIHTGEETSDVSVFPLTVKKIAYQLSTSQDEVRALIDVFTANDLIEFDYETSEILVVDYFRHNPPRGGIRYEGYRKDLAKIKSKRLLARLAEIAKSYPITIGFYSALAEYIEINRSDYNIKPTTQTEESVKTVQQRGRQGSAKKRKKEVEPVTKGVPVIPDEEQILF